MIPSNNWYVKQLRNNSSVGVAPYTAYLNRNDCRSGSDVDLPLMVAAPIGLNGGGGAGLLEKHCLPVDDTTRWAWQHTWLNERVNKSLACTPLWSINYSDIHISVAGTLRYNKHVAFTNTSKSHTHYLTNMHTFRQTYTPHEKYTHTLVVRNKQTHPRANTRSPWHTYRSHDTNTHTYLLRNQHISNQHISWHTCTPKKPTHLQSHMHTSWETNTPTVKHTHTPLQKQTHIQSHVHSLSETNTPTDSHTHLWRHQHTYIHTLPQKPTHLLTHVHTS